MADEAGHQVEHAQGVQVGNYNSQVNNLHITRAQPLGGAPLGVFSAHVAAGRLLKSGHEESVHALAEASLDVAADVLRVVLQHNPDRVIGLIADSHASRAEALVRELTAGAEWLASLPEAIRAIHRCQDAMRWIPDEATAPMCRASPSKQASTGFFRRYAEGNIHWSDKGGAWATTGEMLECHAIHGGSGGRLGFPLSPELTYSNGGSSQRFESDAPYSPAICDRIGLRCGATVYRSSQGAFITWAGIGDRYEMMGGARGWLGFPVTPEQSVGRSPRGTVGRMQTFANGAIFIRDGHDPIDVETDIAEYHQLKGGLGVLGFPLGPPRIAGDSPYGTEGTFQRFEDTADLPADVLAIWAEQKTEATGGAIVYSSSFGTFAVRWSIAALHERMGGTSSWLGFPLEDYTFGEIAGRLRMICQRFEGGVAFSAFPRQAVAVSATVMAALDADIILRRKLGYPRGLECATGIDGVTVQLFDGGVVTVENGIPSVWVRP